MKKCLVIASAVTLTILAGCTHTPIPLATSYPISVQQKMQAAHHWEVLAEHVADRLKTSISATFSGASLPPITVRFSKEQEESAFGKAFHNLMVTHLVQQGLVVLTNSPGGYEGSGVSYNDTLSYADNLVLDYDMQVVQHKDRRLTYPPFGTFTGLAATLWLVGHGIDEWKYPEAAVLPLTVAADLYGAKSYYLPPTTNTEVIITTSVTMNQQYIFNSTDIYYINDGDSDHYKKDYKTYQMVSE